MKKIFLTLTAAALLLSCSDADFDINRDPDNLAAGNVSLRAELPAGIVGVGAAENAYYGLIGGFWAQYFTQGNSSNQYKSIDDYSIGTGDYTAGWAAMYDGLGDLRNVKRLAEEQENWNYYLIATTLEVQASQVMADFYDQIPYSQANSVSFLQPIFETGSAAYDLMEADLKEALSKDLSTSQGDAPSNDDFVFAGDMDKWTAFANTQLLKIYLRQTEARPTVAQTGITTLLSSGVAFLNDDAAITQFENAPDRSNPLYETDRRQLNTQINIRVSTTLYSYLEASADPRLDDLYDDSYNSGGSMNQGDFNSNAAQTSFAVVKLNAVDPVYFMTKEESLFLQAEALERYAAGAGAKAAYDSGVTAMITKKGYIATPLIAAGGAYEYPATGDFQAKLKAIIMQKWTSFFPGNGFEGFFEQNRTGYPEISDVAQTSDAYVPGEFAYSINGITGGQFPKRLVFPQTVLTRNTNAPGLIPNTTTVWWDAN